LALIFSLVLISVYVWIRISIGNSRSRRRHWQIALLAWGNGWPWSAISSSKQRNLSVSPSGARFANADPERLLQCCHSILPIQSSNENIPHRFFFKKFLFVHNK
jgi:hypothetical protein